jgi:hypothetical protein
MAIIDETLDLGVCNIVWRKDQKYTYTNRMKYNFWANNYKHGELRYFATNTVSVTELQVIDNKNNRVIDL